MTFTCAQTNPEPASGVDTEGFFCVLFSKYVTSSMLFMYEMEICGHSEHYIGYFAACYT